MTDASAPKPADRFIPWYIVSFFLFLTGLFAWFVYIAESTYTGVVTDQAYEKGLAYNRTIEKATAQDMMGFTAEIGQKSGVVTFILKDATGKSVEVKKISAVLFRPVHQGLDTAFEMVGKNGVFSAKVLPPEPGLWEIRIRAETAVGPYQAAKRVTFE